MQKLSFQWDIKDFGDCDLIDDEHFDSPRFFVTDPTFKSDWKLRVYPAENKIFSILLLRQDSGSVFQTKHSISLLNRNGGRMHTESCSELCEPSKFTNSTEVMLKAENIVKIKIPKNLDDDVLSILCEIEIYEKTTKTVSSLPVQMRGTSVVIPNTHKPVQVHIISQKEATFYLRYGKRFIFIQGKRSGCSGVYFQIIDDDCPEILFVPITFVNEAKKATHINITRKNKYYSNTISERIDISTRCTIESIPDAIPINITPYLRKLQSDYRHVFSQSDVGDISIAVDGQTLRVHKDILSNRCPVFAAMFNQEWLEQANQKVNITNFDYKTILAMIEFIYFGGGHDDNSEETADQAELLKAAHMYQLDDLKIKCEQRLCQSLDNSNVDSYAALATVYDLRFLKMETSYFITKK